jgi:hypothetical protein
MKVLDLRCSHGHRFEGWFGSDDDFLEQNGRGLIECPLCADRVVTRMPSAPRLNLSGAREPQTAAHDAGAEAGRRAGATSGLPVPPESAERLPAAAADLQAAWLGAVRRLIEQTEDVGERFPEEARRIHYGEAEHRGIRGQATPEQREALREEGIEVVALPIPAALKGPVQ